MFTMQITSSRAIEILQSRSNRLARYRTAQNNKGIRIMEKSINSFFDTLNDIIPESWIRGTNENN